MGRNIGRKNINAEIDVNALKQTLQGIDNKRVKEVSKLAKSYLKTKPNLGIGGESYESNLDFGENKTFGIVKNIAGQKINVPVAKATDPDGDTVLVPNFDGGVQEYFDTIADLTDLLSVLLKTETMFRSLIEQLADADKYLPEGKPYYGKTFVELLNTPGIGDVIRFEQGSLIDTLKKTSDTAKYIASLLKGEAMEAAPEAEVELLEVPQFGRKGSGYAPTAVSNNVQADQNPRGFNEPFTGRPMNRK